MAFSTLDINILGSVTGSSGSGGTGDGQSTRTTVTQASHGFSVGDVVYRNTTGGYSKAKADSISTAIAVGVVESVTSSSVFVLVLSGLLTLDPAYNIYTSGSVYYLSPSLTGGISTTIFQHQTPPKPQNQPHPQTTTIHCWLD